MAAKRTPSKRASKLSKKDPQPKYGRIVLKLSGESLQGPQGFGIHVETIQAIAKELREVQLWSTDSHHGWRGKYIPRWPPKRLRDRTRHGRLHGHAGDGHQRAGAASRAGT
jgi:hypothetical protein